MSSRSRSARSSAAHVADYFERRVIDAVALARPGIEGGEEVFVEIEDRIAPARLLGEDFGREAVDRVAHHGEADAEIGGDLRQRQHVERVLHERMLVRHVRVRVFVHRPAGGFAHQEQAEGERLREGAGEEGVEIPGRIAARFGVGVEHVAEGGADLEQRVVGRAGGVEFGEPLLDDGADQPGGMGHQLGQMLRIAGRGCFGAAEGGEQFEEGSRVVALDQAVGGGILGERVQRGIGDDRGRSERHVPVEQVEFGKIAGAPSAQLLQALELALVVRVAPASGVAGLGRGFQLNERAGRLARPDQSDVRAAGSGILVLGRDGKLRHRRQGRQQVGNEPLKSRREPRLRCPGICYQKLADAARISLEMF